MAFTLVCFLFQIIFAHANHLSGLRLFFIQCRFLNISHIAFQLAKVISLVVYSKIDSYFAMACTQVDSVKGEIYIAFNASHLPVTVTLPERPGYQWEPLVDTGKIPPFDFLTSDLPERDVAIQQYAHFLGANLYPMLSYSSIILLLSPEKHASS